MNPFLLLLPLAFAAPTAASPAESVRSPGSPLSVMMQPVTVKETCFPSSVSPLTADVSEMVAQLAAYPPTHQFIQTTTDESGWYGCTPIMENKSAKVHFCCEFASRDAAGGIWADARTQRPRTASPTRPSSRGRCCRSRRSAATRTAAARAYSTIMICATS